MRKTGWIAGRRLFYMKAKEPSLIFSGELISLLGPTMWWVISHNKMINYKLLHVKVLKFAYFSFRELKSMISVQNSGSQMCCEITSVSGLICTHAACVGKTTPPSLLVGVLPLRFALFLFLINQQSQVLAVAVFHCNYLICPQICVVKERNATEMRDLPSRYVEIGIKYTALINELYGSKFH